MPDHSPIQPTEGSSVDESPEPRRLDQDEINTSTAVLHGHLLDIAKAKRQRRLALSVALVLAFLASLWICGHTAYRRGYSRGYCEFPATPVSAVANTGNPAIPYPDVDDTWRWYDWPTPAIIFRNQGTVERNGHGLLVAKPHHLVTIGYDDRAGKDIMILVNQPSTNDEQDAIRQVCDSCTAMYSFVENLFPYWDAVGPTLAANNKLPVVIYYNQYRIQTSPPADGQAWTILISPRDAFDPQDMQRRIEGEK